LFKKESNKEKVFLVLVFLLAFFPRIYNLGNDFHSIDSDRWFRRSVSFQDNLLKGDFKETYQKQHPGAILMWLGGFGYKILTSSYLKIYGVGLDENIPDQFKLINFFLKFPLVIAIIFLTFISFILVKKLLNKKVAYIYLTILFLDPFLFFYTRQFHLDVLMSLFAINAVLSACLYFKESVNNTKYLIFSAIFSGLAFLTKTPSGAFILGIFLSIFTIYLIKFKNYKSVIRYNLIYGIFVFLVYILAFPANWVNPIKTTKQIIVDSINNTKQSNPLHLFDVVYWDIGSKYYILTFLFRFSPIIVLTNLLIFIFKFKDLILKKLPLSKICESNYFYLPFIGYGILLSLLIYNTKNYERYLIPFTIPLTISSAILINKLIKKTNLKENTFMIIALILLTFSSFSFIKNHPNYMTYKTLFISRDTQLNMFSEHSSCDANLSEIADFLNKKEGGRKVFTVGFSGVYKVCLKPFIRANVIPFENAKDPDYYILFKTDKELLYNPKIFSNYTLIKTFYISKTPVYYVYEKKNRD